VIASVIALTISINSAQLSGVSYATVVGLDVMSRLCRDFFSSSDSCRSSNVEDVPISSLIFSLTDDVVLLASSAAATVSSASSSASSASSLAASASSFSFSASETLFLVVDFVVKIDDKERLDFSSVVGKPV